MGVSYNFEQSIADQIPFDPSVLTPLPTNNGYMFGFDTPSQKYVSRNILQYGREAPIGTTTPTTASGNLQLIVTSTKIQFFTGTAADFSVILPNATTLISYWTFEVYNTTSQTITIKDFSGATLFTLAQNSVGYLKLQLNGTSAGTWVYYQVLISSVATGIINYKLTSSVAFSSSTRSPNYELITGFTLTPQAGTYGVWYNASVYYTTTPKAHFWAIFKNGVVVADSVRQQDTAHSNQNMPDSTMSTITCSGTETIDVRVSCDNTGTLTVNNRTLLLIRLGT